MLNAELKSSVPGSAGRQRRWHPLWNSFAWYTNWNGSSDGGSFGKCWYVTSWDENGVSWPSELTRILNSLNTVQT